MNSWKRAFLYVGSKNHNRIEYMRLEESVLLTAKEVTVSILKSLEIGVGEVGRNRLKFVRRIVVEGGDCPDFSNSCVDNLDDELPWNQNKIYSDGDFKE